MKFKLESETPISKAWFNYFAGQGCLLSGYYLSKTEHLSVHKLLPHVIQISIHVLSTTF